MAGGDGVAGEGEVEREGEVDSGKVGGERERFSGMG